MPRVIATVLSLALGAAVLGIAPSAAGGLAPFAELSDPGVANVHRIGDTTINLLDSAQDVAVGNGTIALVGRTQGSVDGANQGDDDVWVQVLEDDYTVRWTAQTGSDGKDYGDGIALDSDGDVYIAGQAAKSLDGEPHLGNSDGFVQARDGATGTVRWTKHIGATPSNPDTITGIAIDDATDTVFAVGYTYGHVDDDGGSNAGGFDAFVVALDTANGSIRWITQFGGALGERPEGVAFGGGRVAVTGWTENDLDGGGNAGGRDVFVTTFDPATGTQDWVQQFGAQGADQGNDVAIDASIVVVAGTIGYHAGGGVEVDIGGGIDAVAAVLDATTGDIDDIDQFGTTNSDFGFGAAIDNDGHPIVTGQFGAAGPVGFVRGFDPGLAIDWTVEIDSGLYDRATKAAVDTDGTIHVAGFSTGDLGAGPTESQDGFLVAIVDGPTGFSSFEVEPGAAALHVSWDAATSPPAAPVTYTATAQPGGESCTTTATKCSIGFLTPGESYSVTVEADNGGGAVVAGPTSPHIPTGAPTNLDPIYRPRFGAIKVDATADGDDLQWAIIAKFTSSSCGTASCLLTNLEDDTAYDLVTTVANAAGFQEDRPTVTTLERCDNVSDPFNDVAATSFAVDDIACIYTIGVTTGTGTNTYSPAGSVTREQMGSFLARMYRLLTTDPCTGLEHPFSDVAETSFAADDIACIYNLNITKGTSATTYSPTNPVTREQMGAFLARLLRVVGLVDCTGYSHPFSDVAETSFAADDIACILHHEITKGTSATTYSPANPVTREQMGAFLARIYRTLGDPEWGM